MYRASVKESSIVCAGEMLLASVYSVGAAEADRANPEAPKPKTAALLRLLADACEMGGSDLNDEAARRIVEDIDRWFVRRRSN